MAEKPLKKSSMPGVSIRQLVEEIPEGCSTPGFQQKPVTLALQEGKNAIFRAVVCGEPRPEVHWQSAKGELSNCSKYQISSTPGSKEHMLQINKLTGEDTDLYRCIAVNKYGEATCSARLTVIEVGFRKNRKRQKEPQEDLRKELVDFRKMLKKRAPSLAPEKKMDSEQVWQLLMTADRKDYEKICMKYGIVDFRGMLRKLQEMKKEREDKMAQYVNAIFNLRHIRVTKDGVATFDLELDLKDLESKIYLYKDGEMIPYGFNNQTKHCLRRLGKRYNFQIQDLQPEDAGFYQVMVEDAVVFSTELEAHAIPPRVVVPLTEARCEEQGDAVFECSLSNPCPTAVWHFQHQPLRLNDKYEVFVSPDGLTHRLVVRGARFSDMGLYSLSTGLHTSSAWLVVEAGKDKGLQTTGDNQLQTQVAQTSDAEDSRDISGKGGKLREQSPLEGSLPGTGLASGLQLTTGPDAGGFGNHGYSSMGDEMTADSARGPGQERKGFLEAEGGRATLSGNNQSHQQGDWSGNLPGRPHLQGEGPESGRGLAPVERQQQGYGRDSDGDRSWGIVGNWEVRSNCPQAGELGNRREGKEPREDNGSQLDRHDQGQLCDTHLEHGTGKRTMSGSQSESEKSQLKGEWKEIFQGNYVDEMEGGHGLSRERERVTARAARATGISLGEAGDSHRAGDPHTSELTGGRYYSSQAGMGLESWRSQGGRDIDHGEARGYWESGEYPRRTSGDKYLQESLSTDNKLLLGGKGPEAKAEGSLHGTDGQGLGSIVRGRGFQTGPGSLGDSMDWGGGLQEVQGRDDQDTVGALRGIGNGSKSLRSPQSWTARQRRAGEPRIESESTDSQGDTWSSLRKTGAHLGNQVLGSTGGEEDMDSAQATWQMESSQGGDTRRHRQVRSSSLGEQGSGRILSDMKGDSGTVGSESDFWNRSGSSRGRGSKSEMGYKCGLGGSGRVEPRYGSGYSGGIGPGNGAAYSEGSGVPGETGRGARHRVISGASVGTEPEEGGTYLQGSGVSGGIWSRNKDHCGPVGRGSGRDASLRNDSGGPDGMPMDEVWNWSAPRGQGQTGPGGGHRSDGDLGSSAAVGSMGRGGLKAFETMETVGEGHVETEPGASGRRRSWSQTGDYGGIGATGALGALGEEGYEDSAGGSEAMDPGSLEAKGKEGDGDGTRFLGARTGYWGNTRYPEALAPRAGAGAESQWAHGSGNVVGYGDGPKLPAPRGTGDATAYRGESRGPGPGRTGAGLEAGFRDGSGGSKGMGLEDKAGYKNGIGGSGAMGPEGETSYRNGTGDSRVMGSRSEAGDRNGTGGSSDMGLGVEAGNKNNIGGSGAMGPGGKEGDRNGVGGPGATEAGYKNGTGGLNNMGLRGEAGCRNGIGGSGSMESRGEVGYRNGAGVSETVLLESEAGYGGALVHSGDILSWSEAGFRNSLGGAGEMGSGSEVGHSGGSGGSKETGAEGELRDGDGSRRVGGPGSLARVKHEAGPRDHKAMGPDSGHGTASAGATSSKDGSERSRGMGLADGAGPEVGSGLARTLGTADRAAHRDRLTGPGTMGMQGETQTFSDGWGSKNSLGDYGNSGMLEALEAVSSMGKPGVREWQDGSGIPESPRDRGAVSGERGSTGQAGANRASSLLDCRGTIADETWTRIAAQESGCEWDRKAASEPADRDRVAGQRAAAPQGAGDSLMGGRRMGADSGSSFRAGQIVDISSTREGRSKSTSGPDNGQGLSHAWAPGWEEQRFGQGSISDGKQLSGSRASSSLQVNDDTFGGTQKGPGSPRVGINAQGQGATGECEGTRSLERQVSGPRRGTYGGAEDSGILRKGNFTEWGTGLTLEPGTSGHQGTWNNLGCPLSRKGSGGRSEGIQDSGSQLGNGQGGDKGSLGDQGPLEAENGKAQCPRTLKEYEKLGAEEFGGSGKRPGPHRSRFQAQTGAEVGTAKRVGTEESPGSKDRRHLRETQSEDGIWRSHRHFDSRRDVKEGRSDICDEGQNATQSHRSRNKPSTGSPSLEAQGPMGHFSQGLADTEVQQGEDVTLSCTLTSDLGPGTWFKDGVKLTAQDGVIFEQDELVHRLLLAHVIITQAGTYTFMAGNQQSKATLTVQDPPTIAPDVTKKLREPLVIKAGKPVTIKIPFQSRLPVQAAWRKDGTEVVGSSHRGAQVALGDGYTWLCLPSAGRKDSGQYSVTLQSEGGSVQAELTLQVIDKPQPPQGPLEVQHCHRAGVYLHWRHPRDDGGRAVEHYMVERRQAGRSTWLKVGEPPPGSTTFTDAGVEQGRKYAFRVRAVTSEGAGDALESEEVLVAPEALPGPPSAPAILTVSSQCITLTWTAPRGSGSAHILGYLIEKRKKGSNTWTAVNEQPVPERRFTVVDMRQGCQYEFRVTAVAPSGAGEPGPPSDAVFTRDPMRCPGPVRDLQVTDTSNTSITLSWVGPDTQDGDKAQGYVVELCVSDSLQWSPCHVGTVPGTTFTAKGLRPGEGYFVRVIAVNDGGHSQPTALDKLVHAMPATVCPKFLMDSSIKDSLMVRAGDTIRVPVSFEAAPLPEVTWLKDGLPLPKRSVTTTKDGLTQLLIPVTSPSDSGRYTVVLRNLQGQEAAHSFFIRVAAYPQAPGPIHLQENVPGTVTVQWEPSPDEAQGIPLHYSVLTRPLSHGTWREVADHIHTNHFTLLGVLPGHEYYFRVLAKNELGASKPSDTSQPWYIPRQRDRFTVKAPSYRELDLSQKPRFLVGLRAHLLPPGSECRMTCAVQGSPRPRVTWFKNDQSLEGNPALYSTDVLGVCSLIIPSVSPKDSGKYKAVAENPLGQAVSTATLIVTESSS